MRILMVTPRFLPESGGVEMHVAEVARRVADRGHDVTVLTTDRQGTLPPRERWHGVTLERVRAWPRKADYYLAPGIVRRVKDGGWDVVHVQSYHTAVAPTAMAAAASAGIPYVVTFHAGGHSSRVRTRLRGTQLTTLSPLLRRASMLVALAPFEIDTYGQKLRVPAERFVLIPNGADLPAPRSTADRPGGTGPRIASVGRLERYKGHQHVLAALPHILDEQPTATLWIAGAGPFETELAALAEQLGVADRVDIHAVPPTERERMADELAASDIVVLASEFETHPIAVLEAAALGCRVVVADSPGLRELGERGVATVAPSVHDPVVFARAVLDELAAPHVTRKIELPSWDDCADRLCELYRTVAERTRHP